MKKELLFGIAVLLMASNAYADDCLYGEDCKEQHADEAGQNGSTDTSGSTTSDHNHEE